MRAKLNNKMLQYKQYAQLQATRSWGSWASSEDKSLEKLTCT